MPYFFETELSGDQHSDAWELFRRIWVIAHDDLMGVHFETKEEALEQVYRKSLDPNDMRLDSWGVARYRETDDQENLRHFHLMGLDALGETEAAIAQRKLDAHFAKQWSILMSAHGFVLSAMMARGDDLQSRRAGLRGGKARSAEAQQRWFAHYFLIARATGRSRAESEQAVVRLVNAIIDGEIEIPDGFDVQWFERFLNLKDDASTNRQYGKLVKTYRQKKLSEKVMRAWRALPTSDLPLVDVEFPLP